MSGEKWSQKPAASPLTGDEITLVAQSGISKQTTPNAYVTLASGVIVPAAVAEAALYTDAQVAAAIVTTEAYTDSKFPVPNAQLDDMAQATVKGRAAGAGTGSPQDLTQAQLTALVNPFTSGLSGAAPASGGGTTNFLRADGSWAAPGGGGGGIEVLFYDDTFTFNSAADVQDMPSGGTTTLVTGDQLLLTGMAVTASPPSDGLAVGLSLLSVGSGDPEMAPLNSSFTGDDGAPSNIFFQCILTFVTLTTNCRASVFSGVWSNFDAIPPHPVVYVQSFNQISSFNGAALQLRLTAAGSSASVFPITFTNVSLVKLANMA